jgi:hypothetical protein
VGLVDDDERIVVEVLDFPLRTVAEVVKGHHLHPRRDEVVLAEERPPRGILERRRDDDQDLLTVLLGRAPDHLAGDERLAQPDLVADQHPTELVEDPERAGNPVALEFGHVQPEPVLVRLGTAIELVEHPEEHDPRRVRAPPSLVEGREIVRFRLIPQLVEPVDDETGVLPRRIAEIQLTVPRQPGEGEVRRPRQHRRKPRVLGDERLAVQEALGVSPHLHPWRLACLGEAEPCHQRPRGRIGLDVESH